MITLKDMVLLFDAGSLVTCEILPALNTAGWQLVAREKGGKVHPLSGQRGHLRTFKTADAAINTSKQIGFSLVTIKLR